MQILKAIRAEKTRNTVSDCMKFRLTVGIAISNTIVRRSCLIVLKNLIDRKTTVDSFLETETTVLNILKKYVCNEKEEKIISCILSPLHSNSIYLIHTTILINEELSVWIVFRIPLVKHETEA